MPEISAASQHIAIELVNILESSALFCTFLIVGLIQSGLDGLDWTDLGKGKVFPYSLPSVGPRADPGVQAVSPQVT